MSYTMDAKKISLEDILERICTTDLVPSRKLLLEEILEKFEILKQQALVTLHDLRNGLKTPKRLAALAAESGISEEYLVLLRRELESYFPAPPAIKEFCSLNQDQINKLVQCGFKDAAALYDAVNNESQFRAVCERCELDNKLLAELLTLIDLTRVQWVSPTAARMLLACGIHSPVMLASANAEELYEGINRVNADFQYFKGKIGLRDVRRLVHAARYVD